MSADAWERERLRMVAHLRTHGVKDERVLAAMGRVPRHAFVPEAQRGVRDAYGDHPCPIGFGQTISQPFVVAYMLAVMRVGAGDRVLEIGTGSGYQAALLAELGARVFSIERIPELAGHARAALHAQGYGAVAVRCGDGYCGWMEAAPFDVILVACAPGSVPQALAEQLAEGGRMVVPVGDTHQQLVIVRRQGGRSVEEWDLMVRFVPMVPGAQGGGG